VLNRITCVNYIVVVCIVLGYNNNHCKNSDISFLKRIFVSVCVCFMKSLNCCYIIFTLRSNIFKSGYNPVICHQQGYKIKKLVRPKQTQHKTNNTTNLIMAQVEVVSVQEVEQTIASPRRITMFTANSINLKDMKLGDEGLKGVMPLLIDNKSLHKLELCGNNLTDNSIPMLLEACKENNGITEIHLELNELTGDGIKPLMQFISSSESHIRYLSLSGNTMIGTRGAYIIAHMLRSNKTIQGLNLSNCDLKEEGVLTILSVVYHKDNTSIKQLNLKHNEESEELDMIIQSVNKRLAEEKPIQDLFPQSIIEKMPSIAVIQDVFKEYSKTNRKQRKSWRFSLGSLSSAENVSDIIDCSQMLDEEVPTTSNTFSNTMSGCASNNNSSINLKRRSTRNSGRMLQAWSSFFGSSERIDDLTLTSTESESRVKQLESENAELKQRLQTLEFMYENLSRQMNNAQQQNVQQ
jgi:hypothetical protein